MGLILVTISVLLDWDAMLKMTGVKLDKISDIDTYLFVEKGLRGRMVGQRVSIFLMVGLSG